MFQHQTFGWIEREGFIEPCKVGFMLSAMNAEWI